MGYITKLASKWLKRKRKKKFFLWGHLFDPHTPYKPPAPFDKEYKNPYDGEIAYIDQCIGSLVSLLTGKKKWAKLNFNWAPLEGIITPDGYNALMITNDIKAKAENYGIEVCFHNLLFFYCLQIF